MTLTPEDPTAAPETDAPASQQADTDTVTDEPERPAATASGGSQRTVRPEPPTERFVVRLSHPNEGKRAVFSSVSESRARRYVETHFPRGEEAYLEKPDGTFESYQHERTGPYGEDADKWSDFDPESYRPPEATAAPGEGAWHDVEG